MTKKQNHFRSTQRKLEKEEESYKKFEREKMRWKWASSNSDNGNWRRVWGWKRRRHEGQWNGMNENRGGNGIGMPQMGTALDHGADEFAWTGEHRRRANANGLPHSPCPLLWPHWPPLSREGCQELAAVRRRLEQMAGKQKSLRQRTKPGTWKWGKGRRKKGEEFGRLAKRRRH
jgi:hypothetical protein